MNKQKRRKIRKKNLAAFKKANQPWLYTRLINHKPSTKLTMDATGAPVVTKDGKTVYGAPEIEADRNRVSTFREKPQLFLCTKPQPGAGGDRYFNGFLGNVLKRAEKDRIGFASTPTAWNSFFLIVFGIGLGQYLDELIDEVNPTFVVLVESDLDLIYHSLETYRWDRFFARFEKHGYAFFVLDKHPEFIAIKIINSFLQFCSPGIDSTQWFAAKETPLSKGAMEEISRRAGFFAKNPGFFFDESLMMRNTHANLKSGKEKLLIRTDNRRPKTQAFVIGSGPSLDEAIPVIRENAENAIIISGGSALRPLLVNGITPDFHVETENLNLFAAIKQMADSYDLSPICLLASTTIDPSIRRFFDNTLYFFRNFSPFPLFCEDDRHCLRSPDPAIINAEFSFAIDSGIEDIYFFGTDFGTKGEGRHHSKDNIYYTEQAFTKDRRQYNLSVPGNFGGTFNTSDDFLISMSLISAMILNFGEGRRVFNCSEGALLEKATPLRKEEVSLHPIAGGKAALIGDICNKSRTVTAEWFEECWHDNTMRQAINDLSDELLELFEKPGAFNNNLYLADYMEIFGSRRFKGKGRSTDLSITFLYRGTLSQVFTAVAYYHKRLSDRVRRGAFEALVREEFPAVVEALRRDALAIIDDPTDVPKSLTSEVWEKPIEEKPHSWGDISRNAPCPCNSGKRYKHCHGKTA